VQGPDARKLLMSFVQTASIFTLRDFIRCISQNIASLEYGSTHGHTVSFQTEEPDPVARKEVCNAVQTTACVQVKRDYNEKTGGGR
jgi:hypothetical protein